MQTLKTNIHRNHELQKLLEKSKQKRYKMLEKNKGYCAGSIQKREDALNKEYPAEKMCKGRKRFPVLLFLMKCRLVLCGVKICLLNSFDRSKIDGSVIFVPTHIGKFDMEVVYACIKTHAPSNTFLHSALFLFIYCKKNLAKFAQKNSVKHLTNEYISTTMREIQ